MFNSILVMFLSSLEKHIIQTLTLHCSSIHIVYILSVTKTASETCLYFRLWISQASNFHHKLLKSVTKVLDTSKTQLVESAALNQLQELLITHSGCHKTIEKSVTTGNGLFGRGSDALCPVPEQFPIINAAPQMCSSYLFACWVPGPWSEWDVQSEDLNTGFMCFLLDEDVRSGESRWKQTSAESFTVKRRCTVNERTQCSL